MTIEQVQQILTLPDINYKIPIDEVPTPLDTETLRNIKSLPNTLKNAETKNEISTFLKNIDSDWFKSLRESLTLEAIEQNTYTPNEISNNINKNQKKFISKMKLLTNQNSNMNWIITIEPYTDKISIYFQGDWYVTITNHWDNMITTTITNGETIASEEYEKFRKEQRTKIFADWWSKNIYFNKKNCKTNAYLNLQTYYLEEFDSKVSPKGLKNVVKRSEETRKTAVKYINNNKKSREEKKQVTQAYYFNSDLQKS